MKDTAMLEQQALELIREEPGYVAVLSNVSALIMESMEEVNWAGFYLVQGEKLVVGPFQGKPACIHIPMGKGVCGTCAAEDAVQVVPDVHAFPGHIACDSASRSEMVIPLHDRNGRIRAVMDLDSPVVDRFGRDAEGLKRLAKIIEENVAWEG